ncbi:acyltransferase [Glycomyces fuscus]|nr:acyltransferase [Glycomyces fuscus]
MSEARHTTEVQQGTEARHTTGAGAASDGDVPGLPPPARRVVFLDVARALAMIGVVMMNASSVVYPVEMSGNGVSSLLTDLVNGGLNLLMSGRARTMLMVLLGAGVVLAWRAAARRGGRPAAVMLRRYAVLGLLFGLPHLAVFDGDILTQYSAAALLLIPLVPLLLGGSRRRPLVAAAVLFAAVPASDLLLSPFFEEYTWGASVVLVPQTLGFFCVGVWLARRPELTAGPGADARGASRLPLRMLVFGAVVQGLSVVLMLVGSVVFPTEFGADGVPVRSVGETVVILLGHTLLNLGGALLYLGLVWWLVLRGRRASRVLGTLAPLGRMTLTVYLGSTAVFLAVMGPFEGTVPLLAQYALAAAYFVATAVLAHLWARRFRLGPLEWVWRSLTYLRPAPMRAERSG